MSEKCHHTLEAVTTGRWSSALKARHSPTETSYQQAGTIKKKPNWDAFREGMDRKTAALELPETNISSSVALFNKAVLEAAKMFIPRGRRRDYQETKKQTDLQKSAVRPRRHRILSPTERPRHFSTRGTVETGRSQRWILGTPWSNLETGVGPADHYLPPVHRALWSECPSEEDWHFRHFPLWVRTSWPNPRLCPSVLPKICRETSSNMAAGCWSGDQAVGLGRRPLPDSWFCGINQTEDLTCTAVDRWRRRRRMS